MFHTHIHVIICILWWKFLEKICSLLLHKHPFFPSFSFVCIYSILKSEHYKVLKIWKILFSYCVHLSCFCIPKAPVPNFSSSLSSTCVVVFTEWENKMKGIAEMFDVFWHATHPSVCCHSTYTKLYDGKVHSWMMEGRKFFSNLLKTFLKITTQFMNVH